MQPQPQVYHLLGTNQCTVCGIKSSKMTKFWGGRPYKATCKRCLGRLATDVNFVLKLFQILQDEDPDKNLPIEERVLRDLNRHPLSW